MVILATSTVGKMPVGVLLPLQLRTAESEVPTLTKAIKRTTRRVHASGRSGQVRDM